MCVVLSSHVVSLEAIGGIVEYEMGKKFDSGIIPRFQGTIQGEIMWKLFELGVKYLGALLGSFGMLWQ